MTYVALAGDDLADLLARFGNTSDSWQRCQIIKVDLWERDDPRIESVFRQLLTTNVTEEAYFVAQYLAKKGDTNALAVLNSHNFEYPISSWQWSYTCRTFGEHKYAPAISNLIEDLDAASLNVVEEAHNALRAFYPDSPTNFASLEQMQRYFRKRYYGPNQVPEGTPRKLSDPQH